jgi:hypothetical protein
MLSLEFSHAPIGASVLGTARLRLAFADNARGQLRSDCSTRWSMPCRSIRCSRPVTKSVLSPKNKGFCNLVIGGAKPGCLQSGLLAQDESFARLCRAVANDVGERTYDSKRRLNFKAKTPSSPIVSGAHFCGENGRFGCAIRGR